MRFPLAIYRYTFTSFWCHIKILWLILNLETKNTSLYQIWARSSGKYASFFTFLFGDTFITEGCHGKMRTSLLVVKAPIQRVRSKTREFSETSKNIFPRFSIPVHNTKNRKLEIFCEAFDQTLRFQTLSFPFCTALKVENLEFDQNVLRLVYIDQHNFDQACSNSQNCEIAKSLASPLLLVTPLS